MHGQQMFHPESGVSGFVDATATHPDGSVLVRLNDHWFMASECEAA